MIGKVKGCDAPVIERTIRVELQNELDTAAGKIKRTPITSGNEEPVEAEVVQLEEEESTMGTHEIDKHVACLIIKPDIIQNVMLSLVIGRILIEHIQTKNSLESKLQNESISSVGILS